MRVAVVQAAPAAFDTPATLARMRELVTAAAGRGAQMVVFPEAFVGGYPKGTHFGTVLGGRLPGAREWFRRYHAAAIDLPGPELEDLCAAARESGVVLVAGVVERDGATLYCTVVFIGAGGEWLGRHRKLVPTAAERMVWGQGDGSTLTVVDTLAGRVGAVICWENYLPLLRSAMYAKGVDIWCAPTVDGTDGWTASMRHIALEGRCFVVSANQLARRRDYPPDFPTVDGDDPETIVLRGGSCIVDPLGNLLAGPVFDREEILVADLDLLEVVRARYDLDVVGHSSRTDVFRLEVDERPRRPVRAAGGDGGPDPAARE
jgi:nitrilase